MWKRIKLGLWKRADEDEREFARQDLEELTRQAEAGEIDLVYFDGSGFNLWAKIVYAWQKRGERIIVPATRGKSQNVLGFMWHRCQKFFSFVFEGTINSHVVTGCFDIFAQSIEKETVIVIDNAPAHCSQEFDEKIEQWEEQGLKVYFLPTYCPMLNKIEILWKKIKYEWLSWEAYGSQKNLCRELDEILSQIGSKYLITFS